MTEIKQSSRRLKDGTEITTYIREVSSANTLEVEAGTTGYMGGNSSHGCRTYFRIEDMGGTDMEVSVIHCDYTEGGFEVTLGGDCELETIIRALKFITKALKARIKEAKKNSPTVGGHKKLDTITGGSLWKH